jgi:hypothetical protein
MQRIRLPAAAAQDGLLPPGAGIPAVSARIPNCSRAISSSWTTLPHTR